MKNFKLEQSGVWIPNSQYPSVKFSQLDKLIKEEVSKVLNEYEEGPFKQQFFSYVDDMKKMGKNEILASARTNG